MNRPEQTTNTVHLRAEPRAVLDRAWQLAHRLEGLLASAAEPMPTELARIDVRIAGALAGSLSDQLDALRHSRVGYDARPVRRLHPIA